MKNVVNSRVSKSPAVGARLDDEDYVFLNEVVKTTRLRQSEILRRAVKLLKKESVGREDFGFILTLS